MGHNDCITSFCPRLIPIGTCAGIHSTVIGVTAVAILSPRRYKQVFTRFHAQNIGCGHGVNLQRKWVVNMVFRPRISRLWLSFFWDSLVRVTSPSEQLEVIRNFVNGLIISLKRGSPSFHVSLSPDAPAHPSQKDSARCQRFYEHCHVCLSLSP